MVLTILLSLAGIILLIGISVVVIKQVITPGFIQKKYARSSERSNIFTKKYKEADVEYYRGPVMRIGLIAVLLTLLLAFNYSSGKKEAGIIYTLDAEEIIEQDVPATQQVQPPPPPPPPPPPQIEVVEDEVIIEEAPVIEDLEVEVDEVVVATEIVEMAVEATVVVEEEEEVEPDIFNIVEEMPEFPGGSKALLTYLANHINYPLIAQENGIEGTVVLRFVVNQTGGISNIEVLRSVGGGCVNEAIRVVENMPKWEPGRQRGNPVRVYFTMPIRFILE